MKQRAVALTALVAIVLATPGVAKKKHPPPAGVIAASAGEQVIVADPLGSWSQAFGAGIVGWLYPAPGAVLFAPDLTRGRTTVLDLVGRREAARLNGITMPHFGASVDRYVVVAGDVMVVSYPERAVIDRFAAEIASPWQVLPISDTAVLVLERRADEDGGCSLVAVDLVGHQVVSRRRLPGDVRRIALSTTLGLLALADAESRSVPLVDPASMSPAMVLPVEGSPRSVAFLPDGKTLVAAVAGQDRGHNVRGWAFRVKKGQISIKEETRIPITAAPVAMASWPLGPMVAVGLESARIEVVDMKEGEIVATVNLPDQPRDVVWCDLTVPGPAIPEWSDEKPPELYIGNPQR